MRKWQFYTSKEIAPQGWLKRQLTIQAQGLSGNLDKIWRDVRDSKWIGGDAEGWERVPYWLDGFIPLAYLLHDEDMIARAKKYIDAILAGQKPDGWICPCEDSERAEYDSWAVQLLTKVLTVYYDCSGDERIPDALYRAMKNYYDLLKGGNIRLHHWGQYRWFEGFVALNFLWERYHEPWITSLASILHEQGTDYYKIRELWKEPVALWQWDTHIVNLAMAMKYEAISCEILGEPYANRADELYEALYGYNGTAVELFTGDECTSGLSPIQGTELCAVVELMYSYEWLYACTGDPRWAERLETIAFNALPATISDDMWTHQYDQMANQIACVRFGEDQQPIFRTNRHDAHLFGLEPNYGCCTANFNQGWPKLALSAFMKNGDEIVNVLPIPSELSDNGVSISLDTMYPFDTAFTYTVKTERPFTFRIRIPSFAEKLTVDGKPSDEREISFSLGAGETRTIRIAYDVTPCRLERPEGMTSVKWGSLVFSLPISYNKVMYEYEKDGVERKFPYCDYELYPTSPWNYAYLPSALTVEKRGVSDIPFSSEKPPVCICTKAVPIDWGYEEGYTTVCARLPHSTAPVGEPCEVTLYPYGCAKLRMTELPMGGSTVGSSAGSSAGTEKQ